jgi:hypothetical protein
MVRADKTPAQSDRADVSSFFAFRTGRALERNALILGQAFKTFGLNILEVGEQISATAVRSNKAEAFRIVEPFYGAGLGSHVESFAFTWAKSPNTHVRPREGKRGESNWTAGRGEAGEKSQQ